MCAILLGKYVCTILYENMRAHTIKCLYAQGLRKNEALRQVLMHHLRGGEGPHGCAALGEELRGFDFSFFDFRYTSKSIPRLPEVGPKTVPTWP